MAKQTAGRFIDPDSAPRPVFVLSDRYRQLDAPMHAHRRAQLIHVSAGVLNVSTEAGRWVIPPHRGLWIPSWVPHRIASKKPFWLTTLYAEPDQVALPATTCVTIDRLTDELLIAAAEFGPDYPPEGPQARHIRVLLDRLPGLPAATLQLPVPRDARLARLIAPLEADAACKASLGALAKAAFLTERTAARLFLRDTGLTFGQWRQRLRCQNALTLLGDGLSVTEAAFHSGYEDVSSFIATFRAVMGVTPGKVFEKGSKAMPEPWR